MVTNKSTYSTGNPFKVAFRSHYCYRCGTYLRVKRHEKIVNPKSKEARYYSFSHFDGAVVGDVSFVHKVFHCPKCNFHIEFITQLSIEDLILAMEKTERYFRRRGYNLSIDGSFETKDGDIIKNLSDISQIKKVLLYILLDEKLIGTYKSSLYREAINERPYYFDIKKKDLINFIQQLPHIN